MMMQAQQITKTIDHTNLKASATPEDIRQTCEEAKKYHFRAVCINPRWVKLARKELKNTGAKIAAVVDWPIGASPTEVRVFAAKIAKKDGADEIDLVMDIGSFKAGKYEEVLKDFKEIARILPTKVIIETGFLTDEEIKKAAELVEESGAFCVKTSTGIEPKVDIETKASHIKLIREALGKPGISTSTRFSKRKPNFAERVEVVLPGKDFSIKAAGGIKTLKDAQRMIEAGANIIGTSSGVEIVSGKET